MFFQIIHEHKLVNTRLRLEMLSSVKVLDLSPKSLNVMDTISKYLISKAPGLVVMTINERRQSMKDDLNGRKTMIEEDLNER